LSVILSHDEREGIVYAGSGETEGDGSWFIQIRLLEASGGPQRNGHGMKLQAVVILL